MTKRKSWDHGGKTRQQRGYGREWDKLRLRIIQRDKHLCQPCLMDNGRVTAAKQVDHIQPKANGGSDDPTNLRAICRPCHDLKTLLDQGKSPKRRVHFGHDGWPVED